LSAVSRPERGLRSARSAFTILEALFATVMMAAVVIGAFSAITGIDWSARRQADYTSAMALVQDKLEELRATTYNPPTAPFLPTTNTSTNAVSISLNKANNTFLFPGVLITRIEPVAAGHLVTVTGVFTNYLTSVSAGSTNKPPALSVSLQTVVNKFSGGQP
jgi:type II secretory pathway pseudopilin PulG